MGKGQKSPKRAIFWPFNEWAAISAQNRPKMGDFELTKLRGYTSIWGLFQNVESDAILGKLKILRIFNFRSRSLVVKCMGRYTVF